MYGALGWALGAALTGCSTVATPLLRHETAETLGSGRYRVRASLGGARVFPILPASLVGVTTGVAQESGVLAAFQPVVQATAGVIDQLDLSLGTSILLKGGGWRLGAKYRAWSTGALALGAIAGVGRYSARGDVDFRTSTGSATADSVLAASQIDFGVPVSYRIDPEFAVYSGLQFFRTQMSGSVAGESLEQSVLDWGPNLGLHYTRGAFEGSAEAILLRVKDPVSAGSRFQIFFGVSGGVRFP